MIRRPASLIRVSLSSALLIICAHNLYAQNIDSLFQVFVNLHENQVSVKRTETIQSVGTHVKCGFGITAQIQGHFNSFSENQKNILTKILSRAETLDTSRVSPSGVFRIHFDTTGTNAPTYFQEPALTQKQIIDKSIDSLAAVLDSAYNFEVNILGYNPPPPDNGEGGDDLYDVYVVDIGPGLYGQVNPVVGYVPTYMTIHNSFEGFYSSGINGATVTAAHELHHSIQLANYGWHDDSETYFYEMTSTAMEEFVFDEINEYYRDMADYFQRPHFSLVGNNIRGYQDAVFFIYLHERFLQDENDQFKGYDIIKKAWENFAVSGNAINAIAESMSSYVTSLKYELANFGIWCYFTGSRSVPGKYFEEAAYYPQITPFASYEFNTSMKKYSINTRPISNNYLIFELTDQGFHDTLTTIITNCDIEGTDNPYLASTTIGYTLTTDSDNGSHHIVNNYYSEIETDVDDYITESNIFNNEIVSGQTFERETLDFAYPQPFVYSRNNELFIPVEPGTLEIADLNIYTAGMNLIYSGKAEIIAGEKIVVKWNVHDNKGDKLPTGIYIYAVKSGDKLTKGKFVIYND